MQECRIILEGGLEAIQKLCFETLISSKYISKSAQVIEMIAKEGVTASKGFGGLSREGILRCGAYPRHGEQKKMERSKQPYVDTDVKQSMKEGILHLPAIEEEGRGPDYQILAVLFLKPPFKQERERPLSITPPPEDVVRSGIPADNAAAAGNAADDSRRKPGSFQQLARLELMKR